MRRATSSNGARLRGASSATEFAASQGSAPSEATTGTSLPSTSNCGRVSRVHCRVASLSAQTIPSMTIRTVVWGCESAQPISAASTMRGQSRGNAARSTRWKRVRARVPSTPETMSPNFPSTNIPERRGTFAPSAKRVVAASAMRAITLTCNGVNKGLTSSPLRRHRSRTELPV